MNPNFDPRAVYSQGYQKALQDAAAKQQQVHVNFQQQLAQHEATLRAEFEQKMNQQAGGLRKMLGSKMELFDRRLQELAELAKAINVSNTSSTKPNHLLEGNLCRPGSIRIEDIPGKRTPYTLLIEIPIERNNLGARRESFTINMDGPFVAVKRMLVFLSSHQFEVTDPDSGDIAQFASRSYGRYRPINSAHDICDNQHNAIGVSTTWWWNMLTATGIQVDDRLPEATLGLPSNMSSFRTMGFDGRLEVIVEGTDYPRQNISVPSAFWSESISAPWGLGCLDFIERGETIVVKVTPNHVNNPPAGNVTGAHVFPLTANDQTGWPFLDGQYDAHEGIATPGGSTYGQNNPNLPNLLENDSVVRLPDGILIVGWEGYRINQTVGVGL